jgi:4a-hydroxytetrahydrobiopterin dehydratase
MRSVIPKAQLLTRKCRAINSEPAYSAGEILAQLSEMPGWVQHGKAIERCFSFRDFYDTMAFVNALAWIIHREDHHPDLIISYNRCTVRWNTHSVDGVSENDFICAAKTDTLIGRSGN